MSDKLTKKDLKQDEIKDFIVNLFLKIKENKKLARPIIVGIAIIVIAVPVLIRIRYNNIEKSEILYNSAMAEYNVPNPNYQSIIAKLNKAREIYSSSKTSRLSLLNIGNCFLNAKNYKEALANYDKFIYGSGMPEFIPVALIGKAQVYLEQQELDKAEQILNQIRNEYAESYVVPEAEFYLGLIYDKEKKYNEAEKIFKDIKKNNPETRWADYIKAVLLYYRHAEDLGSLPYKITEDTSLEKPDLDKMFETSGTDTKTQKELLDEEKKIIPADKEIPGDLQKE